MTKNHVLHPFRSLRLGLVLIFTLLMAATSWGTLSEVYYLDENGEEQVTVANEITGNVGKLEAGWYMVSGTVHQNEAIQVSGHVHIILLDGASFECELFVIQSSKETLSIYAGNSDRSKPILGTGELKLNNGISAQTSTITVNGGHVTTGDDKDKARLIAALYFYFNGGNVDVETIQAQTLTLAWQNRTDSFKAKSIRGTLSIKENFFFKDEDGELYSGYNISTSSVVGKTLTPYLPPVSYIDENGNEQSVAEYTLLTNDIAKADMDGIITLKDGWYVVPKTNLADTYFDDVTLSFDGDAHIVIEDGAEMKLETVEKTVIQTAGNLSIYGQALGTGKLTAYDSSNTICPVVVNGNLSINGGNIFIRNGGLDGYSAVDASGYVYINSGIVEISSNIDKNSWKKTINTGKGILFDWHSAKDRYTLGRGTSASIAMDKWFKDEYGNVYKRYDLYNLFYTDKNLFDQLILDKTILPCYVVSVNFQDGSMPKKVATSFDENGVAHAAKPEDPTRIGAKFLGWSSTIDGIPDFDWSAPVTDNVTVYARWEMEPVEYIDENGKTQNVTQYMELTGDIAEPDKNGIIYLSEGWYVVHGDVIFPNEIKRVEVMEGDVHIILADGAKFNADETALFFYENIFIYVQSLGSGSLSAKEIYAYGYAFVNGGNITCEKFLYPVKLTVNGGHLDVSQELNVNDLVLNGGSLDAKEIYGEAMTLGWNSIDDHFSAEKITLEAYCSSSTAIYIAKGQAFRDEDGHIYENVIDADMYGSDIDGKMLLPVKLITGEGISIAGIPPVQAYTGYSICPEVVVKDGKKTLEVKKDYTMECFENVEKSSTAPYAKITGMGIYGGEIEKHFAILDKSADYAAVGIFKDEDGHSIASIDGNYGEDGSVNIDEEITVDSVIFERSFLKNTRSTIVLPFSVSTSQIKGLKEVLAFGKIVVENGQKAVGMNIVWDNTSSEHVTLNAYTPYIVLMDGEKLDISGAVTLEVTRDAVDAGIEENSEWEFRGSLGYKKWAEGDPELGSIYGFAASSDEDLHIEVGDFVRAAAGAWIVPMRAYLVKKPSASTIRANGAYAARTAASSVEDLPERMSIVIIKNDENVENGEHTTVIGQFNTRATPFRVNFMPRTYDLKGRFVGNGRKAKGVYYGKKVMK